MKTLLILIFGLMYILPDICHSQTVYDSLKTVYYDEYLFDKFYKNKKNISFEEAINFELQTIWNDSIRDLAGIAVYENAFGFNWTDSASLNRQIDDILMKTSYPEIRSFAKKIRLYANTPLVGNKLIHIELSDYAGNMISTDTFKGEYFIINLWASWIKICMKDMKEISKLTREKKIPFYSISFDEDYGDMVSFVEQKEYDWPVVYAGRWNELTSYFKIRQMPKYFIVDPDGIIFMESLFTLDETVERAMSVK